MKGQKDPQIITHLISHRIPSCLFTVLTSETESLSPTSYWSWSRLSSSLIFLSSCLLYDFLLSSCHTETSSPDDNHLCREGFWEHQQIPKNTILSSSSGKNMMTSSRYHVIHRNSQRFKWDFSYKEVIDRITQKDINQSHHHILSIYTSLFLLRLNYDHD